MNSVASKLEGDIGQWVVTTVVGDDRDLESECWFLRSQDLHVSSRKFSVAWPAVASLSVVQYC